MLTPINQRRVANFKANKRGYWSLKIFAVLFVISLLAEFIANDKPIVMALDGKVYLPVWFTYTEEELGGVLKTEAYYVGDFMVGQINERGWAVWPIIRYSHNTIDWDLEPPYPHPPDGEHWLGTTGGSNDMVAKLIYAFRLSVVFGVSLTIVTSFIGVMVGALQGYFGGKVDLIGQRVVEVWSGLPVLFLLIILASFVEPNIFWLLAILSLFSWMTLVGVVRAEFLRARNFEFVRAARSLGVGNRTIMVRHVLPNAMVATLTYLPFILNASITTLTALDFLGFGLPLDSPSFGRLLSEAKANLTAPWIGLSTFLTLAVMLILLIFIGEAIRDALDPRKATGTAGAVPAPA
ncbi:MAG: ABC transporter permease [Proteobacteria bacterium]|jgi:microcin C transport system permease protein|nr:ABC transporter permease [Pseudomonadota bacterium]